MNKFYILALAVVLFLAVAVCAKENAPEEDGEAVDAEYTPYVEASYHLQPMETLATAPQGRYGAIRLTDAENDTLAQIIWLEARGEPFEGQQAVAEVVFNRMLSPAFPDTLDEVIYQDGQFSTANNILSAEPTETQYIAISAALSGPNIIPLEVVFFSQKGENDNVWGTIGGHVFCYPYYWEGEAE